MPAVVVPVVEPVVVLVESLELDDDLHFATWAVWAFVSFLAETILFAAFAPIVLSRHDLIVGSTGTAFAKFIVPIKPRLIAKAKIEILRNIAPLSLSD